MLVGKVLLPDGWNEQNLFHTTMFSTVCVSMIYTGVFDVKLLGNIISVLGLDVGLVAYL